MTSIFYSELTQAIIVLNCGYDLRFMHSLQNVEGYKLSDPRNYNKYPSNYLICIPPYEQPSSILSRNIKSEMRSLQYLRVNNLNIFKYLNHLSYYLLYVMLECDIITKDTFERCTYIKELTGGKI